MRKSRRLTALFMAVMLIVSIMPAMLFASAAETFSDMPTGWSKDAVTAAVNNGLLRGKDGNLIEPAANLTRAEAATIINRAFGATVKANVSNFTDISPKDWYYDEFAKAVNMRTIVGAGGNTMRPNDSITREEIFTVIARALVLSNPGSSALDKFSDASSVSSWAVPYVSAIAARGYINGSNTKMINPRDNITREEFAQMLHNIFKTYISEPGTVTEVGTDCVMIRTPGVTLKNVTVEKDLVLGDGVGNGDINLENVTVKGRILCRGGEGKVKLTDTTVGEFVVVNDYNGTVNFDNYEDEEPFKDYVENTPATFLTKPVEPDKPDKPKPSGGGGGGSAPRRAYTTEYYFQTLEDLTKYEIDTALTKMISARKDATVSADIITVKGFTFDETNPNNVITMTNDGTAVLKVYYKRNIIKVTFNGVDYDFIYGQKLYDNAALKTAMEGYTPAAGYAKGNFEYRDSDGNIAEADGTTVVSDTMTIISNDTPIVYSIKYVVDGAASSIPDGSYNIENRNNINLADKPSKAGYTFYGWYEDAACTGAQLSKLPADSIGDKTFYGKFESNTPPTEKATLKFENATATESTVKVPVILDKIPSDITTGIAGITIKYTYDTDKLEYKGTTSADITGFTAENGVINWADIAAPITTVDNKVLFEIEFTVKSGATGTADVEFDERNTILVNKNGTSSKNVEFENGVVTIAATPVTKATLKFENATATGSTVTVPVVLDKIPSDITTGIAGITIKYTYDTDKLEYKGTTSADITGFTAENGVINWADIAAPITTVDNKVLFEIEFTVKSGATGTADVEFDEENTILVNKNGTPSKNVEFKNGTVTISTTPITTHSVKVYTGTAEGGVLEKTYTVEDGEKLSDAQVGEIKDIILADSVAGFKNSDGDVHHYIYREIMYKDGDVWKVFDTSSAIDDDLTLCLLRSWIRFSVKTDRTIKGKNVPEVVISVPYSSDTYLVDTAIDGASKLGTGLKNILERIYTDEGIDVYQKILDKAKSKGLIDDNKNILNLDLKLKIADFINVSEIEGEIDNYFDEQLADDDKLADLLSQGYVVDLALNHKLELVQNATLRAAIEADPTFRSKCVIDGYPVEPSVIIDKYISGALTTEQKARVDSAIDDYINDLVKKFINGDTTARTQIRPQINEYAHIGLDYFKASDVYKKFMKSFEDKDEEFEITQDNLVLVRGMAKAIYGYSYDKIKNDFLAGTNYENVIKVLGDDVCEKYVLGATKDFYDEVNGVCDIVEADGTAKTYPAYLGMNVNYMDDFVYNRYNQAKSKLINKLESIPEFEYNSNAKLKALVDRDHIKTLLVDDGDVGEGLSGYKLKDDIMEYYNAALDMAVLAHDAGMYYNTDDAKAAAFAAKAAELFGEYGNKFNAVVMDYINNGNLPKGYTLNDILSLSKKLEDLYNEYEDKINKVLDLYAKYGDRDYAEAADKLLNDYVTINGKKYNAAEVLLEMSDNVFSVNTAFDALHDTTLFAGNSAVQKIRDKIAAAKMNPNPTISAEQYVVDGYTKTVASKKIGGYETGNVTVTVIRYLE